METSKASKFGQQLLLVLVLLVTLSTFAFAQYTDTGALTQSVNDCGVLSTPNAVYTLTNSVITANTCFNLTADNISLNGAGFGITETDVHNSSDYGVYVENRFNVTVKNINNISGFGALNCANPTCGAALYLSSTNNSSVQNISFDQSLKSLALLKSSNNTLSNLLFWNENQSLCTASLYSNSNNNLFSNSSFTLNGETSYGLCLDSSSKNVLSNLSVATKTNFSRGIFFTASSYNIISDVNVSTKGQSAFGFILSAVSQNNTLNNLSILTTGDYTYAIALELNSSYNNISKSNFTTAGTGSDGVALATNSNDNKISNLSIIATGNMSSGISTLLCLRNNVSDTNITTFGNQGHGIIHWTSSNNYDSDITISTSGTSAYPIYLYLNSTTNYISHITSVTSGSSSAGIVINANSSNNTLSDVNLTTQSDHAHGIYVYGSQNNTLARISVLTNGQSASGAAFFTSFNNTIFQSTINANGYNAYGVYLDSSLNNSILNTNISIAQNYSGVYLYNNSGYNILANMLIVTPTNVKVISDASGNNSPNYLVYNNSFGEIRWLDSSNNGFLENLTISKTNISLDDVHLQIRSNSIFMDTNYFSGENINSATQLTFKNVSLSKPIIKKSGADCLSPSCVGSSYNSATHLFTSTVSSFSLYTLVEQCTDGIQNYDETGVDCGGASCVACPSAPSSPPPKSNGGGGGGGGGGSHGGGMSSPISSPISPPSIVPPIVAGENSSVSVDNSTDSSNLSSDAGQVSSANSGNNANSNSDTNSINDASRGPQSQTGQKNADVNADSAGATNSADYPIQTVYPLSSSGDFKILGFDYKWAVIAFLSIVGVILSYMFVSGHDAKVRDLYQVKQYSSGPISKFSGVSARVSSTRAMPIRQNVPPELAEKLKQSIGKYLSVGFSPQQVMKLSVAKGWSPQTIDSMLKDFQRKK